MQLRRKLKAHRFIRDMLRSAGMLLLWSVLSLLALASLDLHHPSTGASTRVNAGTTATRTLLDAVQPKCPEGSAAAGTCVPMEDPAGQETGPAQEVTLGAVQEGLRFSDRAALLAHETVRFLELRFGFVHCSPLASPRLRNSAQQRAGCGAAASRLRLTGSVAGASLLSLPPEPRYSLPRCLLFPAEALRLLAHDATSDEFQRWSSTQPE